MAGLWRESASLIVLARYTRKILTNDFNYKVSNNFQFKIRCKIKHIIFYTIGPRI